MRPPACYAGPSMTSTSSPVRCALSVALARVDPGLLSPRRWSWRWHRAAWSRSPSSAAASCRWSRCCSIRRFPDGSCGTRALARQGLRALAIRTLFVWAGLLIVTLLFSASTCSRCRARAARVAAGDDPLPADLRLFAGDHVPHAVLPSLLDAAAHAGGARDGQRAAVSDGRTSWCTTGPRSRSRPSVG